MTKRRISASIDPDLCVRRGSRGESARFLELQRII